MRPAIALILICMTCSACTSTEESPSTTTGSTNVSTSAVSITRPVVDPANWTMGEFVDGESLQ
jgi:hypothetical protein